MYLDPVASRGRFTSDPTDSAITPQVIVQLRRFLENSDAIRSFETRRMAVDILKKLQSLDAYQALVEGRAVLVVQRASLSGTDALLAEDVIRRLDAATSPYFDR